MPAQNPVCPHCHVQCPTDPTGKCTHCGKKPAQDLNCKVGKTRPANYPAITPYAHDGSGAVQ